MTHDLAKQSKASQANIGDDADHDDDDECDRRFIWNILSVVSLRKEINVSEKFTWSVFRCHGKHFFSALDRSENYFRDSFLQNPFSLCSSFLSMMSTATVKTTSTTTTATMTIHHVREKTSKVLSVFDRLPDEACLQQQQQHRRRLAHISILAEELQWVGLTTMNRAGKGQKALNENSWLQIKHS